MFSEFYANKFVATLVCARQMSNWHAKRILCLMLKCELFLKKKKNIFVSAPNLFYLAANKKVNPDNSPDWSIITFPHSSLNSPLVLRNFSISRSESFAGEWYQILDLKLVNWYPCTLPSVDDAYRKVTYSIIFFSRQTERSVRIGSSQYRNKSMAKSLWRLAIF